MQRDNRHPLPFPDDGLVFDYRCTFLSNRPFSSPCLVFSVSMAILRRRLHDGGFTDPIDGQEPVAPRWYKWLDDVAAINITPEMKFAGKQRNVVKQRYLLRV